MTLIATLFQSAPERGLRGIGGKRGWGGKRM